MRDTDRLGLIPWPKSELPACRCFLPGRFAESAMHKKTYAEQLLDPRWQQLRLRVFERDNWTCRNCGDKEKTLNAHHVQYHPYSEGPWEYYIETIITLCKDCHSEEHDELAASKANVILALVKMGCVSSYDFDSVCNILSKISIDDLTKIFLEKEYGQN